MRRLERRHLVSLVGSETAARAVTLGCELEIQVDGCGLGGIPEVRWRIVEIDSHTSLFGFAADSTKRRQKIIGNAIARPSRSIVSVRRMRPTGLLLEGSQINDQECVRSSQ